MTLQTKLENMGRKLQKKDWEGYFGVYGREKEYRRTGKRR